jgi:hypothetical protein
VFFRRRQVAEEVDAINQLMQLVHSTAKFVLNHHRLRPSGSASATRLFPLMLPSKDLSEPSGTDDVDVSPELQQQLWDVIRGPLHAAFDACLEGLQELQSLVRCDRPQLRPSRRWSLALDALEHMGDANEAQAAQLMTSFRLGTRFYHLHYILFNLREMRIFLHDCAVAVGRTRQPFRFGVLFERRCVWRAGRVAASGRAPRQLRGCCADAVRKVLGGGSASPPSAPRATSAPPGQG